MNNSKVIPVSMDEWIWNKYFLDFKGNRSAYVIEHFISGIESDELDSETIKRKQLLLIQENTKLKNQIKELENRIAKFKRGEKEYTQEEFDLIMYKKKTRAEIKSGLIGDLA
jgi:hypothetical protein